VADLWELTAELLEAACESYFDDRDPDSAVAMRSCIRRTLLFSPPLPRVGRSLRDGSVAVRVVRHGFYHIERPRGACSSR
jgi:hypothetical protein